jgi:hypothetical protein
LEAGVAPPVDLEATHSSALEFVNLEEFSSDNQAGKEVLVPFPADAMRAWPISPRVNSPKNNDLDLITPVGGTKRIFDPRFALLSGVFTLLYLGLTVWAWGEPSAFFGPPLGSG